MIDAATAMELEPPLPLPVSELLAAGVLESIEPLVPLVVAVLLAWPS